MESIDDFSFFFRGLFYVPHIAHCYLINGTLLQEFTPEYIDATVDPDVKFSQSLRDAVVILFVLYYMICFFLSFIE